MRTQDVADSISPGEEKSSYNHPILDERRDLLVSPDVKPQHNDNGRQCWESNADTNELNASRTERRFGCRGGRRRLGCAHDV